MRHPTMERLYDPHVPNNPPDLVARVLEEMLNEISEAQRYGTNFLGIEQRLDRLESVVLVLAGYVAQRGI